MKTILKTILCILALAVSVHGATYTVKPSGGNFTTIQACANAAVNPGDSCTVYAGTYNEYVSLSHAGSSGNLITFQVNPGDTVQVYGFHVLASYVVISGFFITDPSLTHAGAGVDLDGSWTGVQILNNTITQVGMGDNCIMMHGSTVTHFTVINGNTISWCSSVPGAQNASVASAVAAYGDHILATNNSVSHVINGFQTSGDHNVFLNNSIGPVNDAIDFPGCHETNPCDTHFDGFEMSSTSASFIVVEGNYQHDILGVGGAHFELDQSTGGSHNVISRFNRIYNNGGGIGGDGNTGFRYLKLYNNTIVVANTQGSSTNLFFWGPYSATNGAYLNNLQYDTSTLAGAQAEYYSVDPSSASGFVGGYNLGWDTGCSPETSARCTTGLENTDTGNVYADPKLVNPTSDFHLQAGSPAIGAGGPLTIAKGSGSNSTALTVKDAGFFQDGYGIAGVQPDWIRVGALTTAQISSINYSTNVITLATGISWNNSDPIYLYKSSSGNVVLNGALPDIGAYSVLAGPPPTPPKNPTAVPY